MIKRATEQLKKLTGLEVSYTIEKRPSKAVPIDGIISIPLNHGSVELLAETKKEIRSTGSIMPTAILLRDQMKSDGIIFISNYITPEIKTYLMNNNLNYLETAGNCYIKTEGIFIFIEGQNTSKERKSGTNVAFKVTGMKLIFALLVNPDLLNNSYRSIADAADISLGSVGKILTDLERLGYIKSEEKIKSLHNKNDLLLKWMELFPHVIKRKLKQGTVKSNSTVVDLDVVEGVVISDNDDNSVQYTIFTNEDKVQLKSGLGLTESPNGNIEIVKPFWNEDINSTPKYRDKIIKLLKLSKVINSKNSSKMSEQELKRWINEITK